MTDGLHNLHLSNSYYSPSGLELYPNSGVQSPSYQTTMPPSQSLSPNTAAAAATNINTWTSSTTNTHPFITTKPGGELQYNNNKSLITNNAHPYQQQPDRMNQPQKVIHYVIHHGPSSSSSVHPNNCNLVINDVSSLSIS